MPQRLDSLSFVQLDRDNVELSARPVLVDLRKMVENLARITEMRVQPGQPAIDVIVSVSPNVPPAVYLDETYTFRVRHNLLLSGGPRKLTLLVDFGR